MKATRANFMVAVLTFANFHLAKTVSGAANSIEGKLTPLRHEKIGFHQTQNFPGLADLDEGLSLHKKTNHKVSWPSA